MVKKKKGGNKVQPAKSPKSSFGTEETSVKVIIRVRPFIEREKKLKAKQCLDIHDAEHALTINDLEEKNKPKKYTYDQVFGDTVGQGKIFENGPRQIIEKALVGFNGTIFCYGQTGSGKTFTMYGTKEEPGIVYQANQFIQEFINQQKGTGKKYKREVTFVEIYKEQLKDLLIDQPKSKKSKKGSARNSDSIKLQIREDPVEGVYIENAIHKEINNADDLKHILDMGQKLRTVAATEMNSESSRSHSVLGIHITIESPGNPTPQTSTLYLVDLAGSEKAGAMNKGGDSRGNERLQEGIKINLSLSSLGGVIKALCENQKHIPYRGSVLTMLLKNSLGGNSMTMLIANMSPANTNYADTLSTLQFANRAKAIKNKASKYKDAKSAKIAELNEEIRQLRADFETYKGNCKCQGDELDGGKCCLVM